MYKMTIDNGKEVIIYADTDRKANALAEEYISFHFGFRAHEVDYRLSRVTDDRYIPLTEEEKIQQTEHKIRATLAEVGDLLTEKNAGYGEKNLCKHGHLGIMVRLSDKIARLEHMIDTGSEVDEDIYKDIAGYAINGLRLMREGRI